jgi:hypothetical protein
MKMKQLRWVSFTAFALLIFVGGANAQKKAPKKPSTSRNAATTTQKLVPPLEVRAAREKADIQLSNVNEFLARLAPLAANLETAIADQKAGKLKTATSGRIDKARTDLVQAVHDIGGALNTLESEFRTKPALSRYLPTIQGIAELAAESEDAASAGRFVASKEPLRKVVQKLTDTLALMPR